MGQRSRRIVGVPNPMSRQQHVLDDVLGAIRRPVLSGDGHADERPDLAQQPIVRGAIAVLRRDRQSGPSSFPRDIVIRIRGHPPVIRRLGGNRARRLRE